MQWLIDIAMEAMEQWIYDNGIYRPRPGVYGIDYTIGDFIKDFTWYELDLSGIIPEHAKAAHVHAKVRSNAIGDVLYLRQTGSGLSIATCTARPQVANVYIAMHAVVALDTNRKIDYRINNGAIIGGNMTIKGWWL